MQPYLIHDAQGDTGFPDKCPSVLREWIFDPNLTRLPNNETRGHIEEDIARYLYAATYAAASGRSPRAGDFPRALAARHRSWNTGKFADRFRVQLRDRPSTTITSHISKDGHYFIHPRSGPMPQFHGSRGSPPSDISQTTTSFHGGRTQQYVQVGNAVPPYLAWQIARELWNVLERRDRTAHLSHGDRTGEYHATARYRANARPAYEHGRRMSGDPRQQELELPPRASSLVESLRDMGYSLRTALADVIDNSITAGAP